MPNRLAVLAVVVFLPLLLGAAPEVAPGAANESPAQPVIVLDTTGFWRMHNVLKPPVVQSGNGPAPVLFNQAWLDTPTASPPDNWTDPGFDDRAWFRAPALRAARTPYLSRLCLRGKFEVTDPAKVQGLTVSLGYHGGAVVYLNGKEVTRGHMPAGPVTDQALAEAYPDQAFVNAKGAVITGYHEVVPDRYRALSEVPVPGNLLRKGVNVLAVEVVRAPYSSVVADKEKVSTADQGKKICWYTCEILRVRLSAPTVEGLVPNAVRAKGIQVWNSELLASDYNLDFGDPCEKLQPVRIVGTRGGTFSGKVVVGSDQPIRGLKATMGDLKNGSATIPVAAVRVRYALPWGDESLIMPWHNQVMPYAQEADVFGALAEVPPEEIPVRVKKPVDVSVFPDLPTQPAAVFGAVVPVWVTVAVPAGATPGRYVGELRIAMADAKPTTVTVELQVEDWPLPESQNYQTWLELVQSPDTLAMEYGLDLWSDRHWEMIAQAFKYAGEPGSRVVHVPLIAQTNFGNAQSMVRWIRKSDGQYDYDFTILDKYLDVAEKNMGRPKIVCLWVWDIYLLGKQANVDLNDKRQYLKLLVEMGYLQGPVTKQLRESNYDPSLVSAEAFKYADDCGREALRARTGFLNKGPLVTVLDPATGKTEDQFLPPYDVPASKALWAPLLTAIQERMKARGLEKAMMFGMLNDSRPTAEEFNFFADLCPTVPWVCHSHGSPPMDKPLPGGKATLGYAANVWAITFSAGESLHGWQGKYLFAYYERGRDLPSRVPSFWIHMPEMCITGTTRGIARMGADFWPAVKDNRGRRTGYVWARYPQSAWRNLDLGSNVLVPGPDGPLASPHLQYLHEGIEHSEARIFLEQALLNPERRAQMGDGLATRCREALDQRQRAMALGMAGLQTDSPWQSVIHWWLYGNQIAGNIWFQGSGWQERSAKLFRLAGEVGRKLSE